MSSRGSGFCRLREHRSSGASLVEWMPSHLLGPEKNMCGMCTASIQPAAGHAYRDEFSASSATGAGRRPRSTRAPHFSASAATKSECDTTRRLCSTSCSTALADCHPHSSRSRRSTSLVPRGSRNALTALPTNSTTQLTVTQASLTRRHRFCVMVRAIIIFFRTSTVDVLGFLYVKSRRRAMRGMSGCQAALKQQCPKPKVEEPSFNPTGAQCDVIEPATFTLRGGPSPPWLRPPWP